MNGLRASRPRYSTNAMAIAAKSKSATRGVGERSRRPAGAARRSTNGAGPPCAPVAGIGSGLSWAASSMVGQTTRRERGFRHRMSEFRQRWRLTVCRGPDARDVAHRDVVSGWEAALRASGLPLAETAAARPRPRILCAAPVPVGMLAQRELIDVGLTECRLVHEVREAVGAAAPSGYRLVDLYDVWTGAPTLPSLVVAADYRAWVRAGPGADSDIGGEDSTDLGRTL